MTDWKTLEIARDFDYNDPRGLMLDVIVDGVKERWCYPVTVREAHESFRALLDLGAEYLPTSVCGEHWRWAGADVKAGPTA